MFQIHLKALLFHYNNCAIIVVSYDSKVLNATSQSTSSNETLWEWIYAFEDLQAKFAQLVL
jgi:hypothetical protein